MRRKSYFKATIKSSTTAANRRTTPGSLRHTFNHIAAAEWVAIGTLAPGVGANVSSFEESFAENGLSWRRHEPSELPGGERCCGQRPGILTAFPGFGFPAGNFSTTVSALISA